MRQVEMDEIIYYRDRPYDLNYDTPVDSPGFFTEAPKMEERRDFQADTEIIYFEPRPREVYDSINPYVGPNMDERRDYQADTGYVGPIEGRVPRPSEIPPQIIEFEDRPYDLNWDGPVGNGGINPGGMYTGTPQPYDPKTTIVFPPFVTGPSTTPGVITNLAPRPAMQAPANGGQIPTWALLLAAGVGVYLLVKK